MCVLMWASFSCAAACSRTLAAVAAVVAAAMRIVAAQPIPSVAATPMAIGGPQAVAPAGGVGRWMRCVVAVARKADVVAWFAVVVVDRHVRCDCLCGGVGGGCWCCCFGYDSMGRHLPIY